MTTADSHLRWLALGRVEGLGCLGFTQLREFFGDPSRAFDASGQALGRVEGLSRLARSRILTFQGWEALTAELELATAMNARLVRYCDETYPARLREIPDPPPTFFVKGSLEQLEFALGVVGSRRASEYGRRMTRQLCEGLAALGICIVSGSTLR